MTTQITVTLPDSIFRDLEKAAQKQRTSISNIVNDLVRNSLPAMPQLPADIETELASFPNLSDDVLWLIARNTMPEAEQQELAKLNQQAKLRQLNSQEDSHREILLAGYHRALVRRAEAVKVLSARGYDLSDPIMLLPS